MPLLRDGRIAEAARVHVADADPLPLEAGVTATVSLARFLAEREALLARNAGLGVRLEPADDPALLREDLQRLSLIEVNFPKYTDGRGYSHAQLLRRRYGYAGELRAVGHVLRDQLGYMVRAGFDAMDYDSPSPESDYLAAMSEFSEVYQATADGRETVFQKRWKRPRDAAGETPKQKVARLNAELRGADASQIIRVALREFGRGLTYVSSFGAESAAMLGLIADVDPATPIIFIDTGMHFQQTLQYRDEVARVLGLIDLRTVRPLEDERRAVDPKGLLHKSDPDACCEVRKVRPLEPALRGFEAWITGRKRFHGGGRLNLPVFEYAEGKYKVNPLADWTHEDVEAYFVARGLPRHPLVADGYPSIGCWPCTVRPTDPNDVRSGRWVGFKKSECGLHLERKDRPRVF
jgi:phosphoadenosine phosphosulfate reductase